MGMIKDIVDVVTGKTEGAVQADAEASTVIEASSAVTAKKVKMSLRRMRVNRGLGMLDVNGNYQTQHDLKCLALMGCDLSVLGDLLSGSTPDHAPNSEEPHPLCAV